jgi:hypothetical protein
VEFDVAQLQFKNRQLYHARTRIPTGYVNNYSWEDAVLADIRNEHGRPGYEPHKLAGKIGSDVTLAAYGKVLNQLDKNAEGPSKKKAALIADVGLIVANDSSRSYPPQAFAAAARIQQRDLENLDDLHSSLQDDSSATGWSAEAESLLNVARGSSETFESTDSPHVNDYMRKAEEQRASLADPSMRSSGRGKALSRAPAPSQGLISARMELVEKEWEFASLKAQSPSGFLANRKYNQQKDKLRNELADLTKRVAELENNY